LLEGGRGGREGGRGGREGGEGGEGGSIKILNEIWREKKPNCASRGVTFRAKCHSKSLYSVEKKIGGISQ
jgi:hypothetical protein